MKSKISITRAILGPLAMALGLILLPTLVVASKAPTQQSTPVPSKPRVEAAYGKLPLSFESNQGQSDSQVKFLSHGQGYTLFLTPTEAVLALRSTASPSRVASLASIAKDLKPATDATDSIDAKDAGDATTQPTKVTQSTVLRMRLVGANPASPMSGLEELPGKVNYFIGKDSQKWRTNIPTYTKVKQPQVYPGIDLVYYGNQRQLEFDFIVAPGADPNTIKFNAEGAERVEVDRQGDLVLHLRSGELRLQKPAVYQTVDGGRQEVGGRFVVQGSHQVSFQIDAYDINKPLIIDPTLVYSTYLGGSSEDGLGGATGSRIAVDAAGNAYVTGNTLSADFPTTTLAFDTTFNGDRDAFVTKLNPTGSGLVYSTYLGGSGGDDGGGIAVDVAGNAYVTGITASTDFPTTTGAFDTSFNGSFDGFVTNLDPTGTALVYSTYLGGSSSEGGSGIAVDAAGNAYVTSVTLSTDFPTTTGAFDTTFNGLRDAIVTKLNPTGSAPLIYSTYLGGSGFDDGVAIAVDATGNAYVAGGTTSADFPTTTGAFDTTFNGGFNDAFVTKLNPTGSAPLVYSTYLGGSGSDGGAAIAVDAGNAYVTGNTSSTDFPTTTGAFDTTPNGSFDAFVTKLNPTGSAPLVYSTYLGGSGGDGGQGIAVDATGNAYVTGITASTDFPTTMGAFQTASGGSDDAFVTKLNPTGSAPLVYSTYLGGSGHDNGRGIAVDPFGNAYVIGSTASTDFPVTSGAFDTTFNGGSADAFVAKIIDVVVPPQSVGKVTGGGTINVPGGKANFGFIVQRTVAGGPVEGHLTHNNHASGAKIRSVTFTSFFIAGNTASFEGTCTNNGAPCTFKVTAIDNGEPGSTDEFTISISGGTSEGGILRSGNIQIHE